MRTKRRIRIAAVVLATITCLVLFILWQVRQANLNYSLSDAASRRDLIEIVHLLRQGADPHARWSGYRFRDVVARMLHREPPSWHDRTILEVVKLDAELTALMKLPTRSLPSDSEIQAQIRQSERYDQLFAAITANNNAQRMALLKSGIPLDAMDRENRTPLVYAIFADNQAAVVYLLRAGANPNARTTDGRCVLHNAQSRGAQFVPLLLKAGAKPNVVDNDGDTPLVSAAQEGDLANVQLLLRYGADPNLGDPNQPGALDWAAFHGYVKVVRVLKAAGARVRQKPTIGF